MPMKDAAPWDGRFSRSPDPPEPEPSPPHEPPEPLPPATPAPEPLPPRRPGPSDPEVPTPRPGEPHPPPLPEEPLIGNRAPLRDPGIFGIPALGHSRVPFSTVLSPMTGALGSCITDGALVDRKKKLPRSAAPAVSSGVQVPVELTVPLQISLRVLVPSLGKAAVRAPEDTLGRLELRTELAAAGTPPGRRK